MNSKELLSSKSLRITDFRISVLDIFLSNENAVSARQIENTLGSFDRITLYRTLKSFKEKGIIHEIHFSDLDKKFALCESSCSEDGHQHSHIHFHCSNCNETFLLPAETPVPKNLEGFQVSSVEVQATGVCKNCQS
ncbi:MAG: transcriptional repressor [Crocinitomicaceae bacterium]|nr:transcriptional repressor [Crocinitomicaceae bacterium]